MSLAIAPLGSMPNINLPYNIPQNQQARRSPIEEAIMAMLVGAAGSAGQQVMSNAMTREHVDTYNALDPDDQRVNPPWWKHALQGPGASGADVKGKQIELQEIERFLSEQTARDRQIDIMEGNQNETTRTNQARENMSQREFDETTRANAARELLTLGAHEDQTETNRLTRERTQGEMDTAKLLRDPQVRAAIATANRAEAEANPERMTALLEQIRAVTRYYSAGTEGRAATTDATQGQTDREQQAYELFMNRFNQQNATDTTSMGRPLTRPLPSDPIAGEGAVLPSVVADVVNSNPAAPPIMLPPGMAGGATGAFGPLANGVTQLFAPEAATLPPEAARQLVIQRIEQFIQEGGLDSEQNIAVIDQLMAENGLTPSDFPSLQSSMPVIPVEEPMIQLNWPK